MTDRVPGAPGQYSAVISKEGLQKLQEGEAFAITLTRDDQPIKEGTPYSKTAVLPDEVAAAVCPGVEDPAPKDAFAALQENKADTVRHRSGTVIAAGDSAHTPVKGLKLYGRTTQDGTPAPEAPIDLVSAGDSGSVNVNVCGKNLIGFSDFEGITTSINRTYSCKNGVITCLFSSQIQTNIILNSSCKEYMEGSPLVPGTYVFSITYPNGGLEYEGAYIEVDLEDGTTMNLPDGVAVTITQMGTINRFNAANKIFEAGDKLEYTLQIECGNTATEYEPYQELQTLSVSTPNGLRGIMVSSGGNYTDPNGQQWICDEIDFARGVYIQRVAKIDSYTSETVGDVFLSTTGELSEGAAVLYPLAESIETALTEEELAQYAKLHTNEPTTTVFNDGSADMELIYYTPTTAVQMVHSPADAGKTFTIDEHGCVTLIRDNPVIACGLTTIDGTEWYYRKWADGFAECWAHISYEGDWSSTICLFYVLPFYMDARGFENIKEYVSLRNEPGYNPPPSIGTLYDHDVLTIGIDVHVPNDPGDETVQFTGNVYLTGWWKTPEVSE